MRRRTTLLALAAATLLAAGCADQNEPADPPTAPTATGDASATPTPTEESSSTSAPTTAAPEGPELTDITDVHAALGCTTPLAEGIPAPDHPEVLVYTCTEGTKRTTLAEFASADVGTVYADDLADDIEEHKYQHAVAEMWSVWGSDDEVITAALDVGASLHPSRRG